MLSTSALQSHAQNFFLHLIVLLSLPSADLLLLTMLELELMSFGIGLSLHHFTFSAQIRLDVERAATNELVRIIHHSALIHFQNHHFLIVPASSDSRALQFFLQALQLRKRPEQRDAHLMAMRTKL